MKTATKAIHVGNQPDPETGAVIPPIYQTSTFAQSAPGEHRGFEYTRSHNPTRTRLEQCLASLEKAKFALTTASGMSAVTLIMHTLKPGSTIICSDDLYGGTYRLFTTVFDKTHNFVFLDTSNLETVSNAIKEHSPDMLWIETPTNPLLKISDLKGLAKQALEAQAKMVVDNTFLSPYFQNPLDLGADIVLHSMTKYLNGHSDVVGGCLMLNDPTLYDQLWTLQNSIGPSQSPFDSWLVLRGLKTLGVRMQRHEQNAKAISEFLEAHPKVEKVIYPGLASHPQSDMIKSQMSGYGGMISFYLKGDLKTAKTFLGNIKLFTLAESLGGVESLIEHPAIMTHASIPRERREELGITDTLIRLSVGIEDLADLKQDLINALEVL
jgi:cystathionine gamma-lyase